MIAWDMDDIKTLSNCEEKVQHSSKNVANELNPSLGIIANKRAAEGYDEPQHTPLVLQVVRGEGSSSTCYPKISLDKRIIDCNQRNLDLVNNIKSSCRQIRSEVDESGKGSSPLCITPEVVRSVGAQLELLHHELFLTKKKVKERNRQILKLERIINNQNEELQHNCEGSSNLIKLTELLFGAVDMQNKQLENMRNIKRRLLSLEDSPFVSHKPINIQKSKKYSSPNLMQVPEQGNPRIINQCDHICNFECKTGNKTTLIGYSRPKLMCAEEKKKEELKSPDYSSEISHGCEGKNHSIENRDELEKQRMINCQLNEHLMKLQEEIKTLKLKIEKLEEQEVAACKHSSLSEKEKQTLLEQLSNLTRQNSKLHGHVSQIDRERDKAVRELDSSDEIISNMGIEVQRANFEARNFECQLSVSAVRCRCFLENDEIHIETLE